MKNVKKKPNISITDATNPFDKRDADIVWKELLTNSKPVSREEVLKHFQKKKSGK